MRNLQLIAVLLCCLFSACGEKSSDEKWYAIEGYAQGTTFTVQYLDMNGRDFQYAIDSILRAVDMSMSSWKDSSIISKINRGTERSFAIDSIFKQVYILSEQVSKETSGAFNSTLAPVIEEWGIGFSNPKKLSKDEVDSLLEFVGYDKFELKGMTITKKIPDARLDFNAIAQGYSVDLIGEFLEKKGIADYLIELGGEIRARGKNKYEQIWKVGIDQPVEANMKRELNAIISLDNKSLATSGNYRKYYEVNGVKYPHSIDPINGFPVQHNLLSATVICETAALADAYATAFMVMGMDRSKEFLEQHKELEVYFIFSDSTSGFGEYYSESLGNQLEILQ